MKRIFATAGFAAIGVLGLQAANSSSLTPQETSKPWSVSAALRGFYDDNYALRPNGPAKDKSFGVEVQPSVKLNWVGDQTYAGLSYDYGMKWYEGRPNNSADHSHQVNARLNHAFSERHKLDLSDSFVVAREPQLIEPTGPATAPITLRSDGDNMRNTASIGYTAELTRLLSLVLGYSNSFYDYEQKGFNSSYSALLDRMEHMGSVNLRYQAISSTVFLVGYQYGKVGYTSEDELAPGISSKTRNNTSHYAFVGVDHFFTHQLSGSLRGGVQFTDYDNRLGGGSDNEVSPYADASLTWTYSPGSSVQLGVRHSRNQTDVAFFGGGAAPTLDQESTTAYGSWTHRITAKLKAGLIAQYQHSEFAGGNADGLVDDYFTGGVNVSYQFNTFLSGELGYSYDKLDSELAGRGFTRNRVYVGVRAVY